MPTFFERFQEYQKLPEAIQFSKNKFKELHKSVTYNWNKYHKEDKVELVQRIENGQEFTVRNYPDSYSGIIDKYIWTAHLKILNPPKPPEKIIPPTPTSKKTVRKRILIKP